MLVKGKSRGIATIEFFTATSAAAAITKFHSSLFHDRELTVQAYTGPEETAHPTTVFVSKLSAVLKTLTQTVTT